MNLYLNLPDLWFWICITLALVLFTSFVMNFLSTFFVTNDGSIRKFSIMDLEFPSKTDDIPDIIRGIYDLKPDYAKRSLSSLKKNLYIDFLFMPAIYGLIFLLCLNISSKTTQLGHPLFASLAWLQWLAMFFDVIENIYLLKKIKPQAIESSLIVHKIYVRMVVLKWLIALIGGICSAMVLLYFWLTGNYNTENLIYLMVLIFEITVFILLNIFMVKKKKLTDKYYAD